MMARINLMVVLIAVVNLSYSGSEAQQELCKGGPRDHWFEQTTTCYLTCDNTWDTACPTLDLIGGCRCENRYVRRSDGMCVLPEECRNGNGGQAGYGPQPGTEHGPQPGPGYGAQPGPGYGPQTGTGSGPQPAPGYGPQAGTGNGPQPVPGYGPQPGPGYGPQPGPGDGPQTGPGYGPQPGTESGRRLRVGNGPQIGGEYRYGYGPGSGY